MLESHKIAFLRKFKNIPGFDYSESFKEAMVKCLVDFHFTHDELRLISEAAQQIMQETQEV